MEREKALAERNILNISRGLIVADPSSVNGKGASATIGGTILVGTIRGTMLQVG